LKSKSAVTKTCQLNPNGIYVGKVSLHFDQRSANGAIGIGGNDLQAKRTQAGEQQLHRLLAIDFAGDASRRGSPPIAPTLSSEVAESQALGGELPRKDLRDLPASVALRTNP
jgi:hypothetical protein